MIVPSILQELKALSGNKARSYSGSWKILEEIRSQTQARGLKFEFRDPVSSRDRSAFIIYRESDSEHIISGGYIVQTSPKRQHNDKAWNRMNQEEKQWLEKVSNSCKNAYVIQIWQDLERYVLIPFPKLIKTKKFTEKGDFTVIKEGENFKLQGHPPDGDDLEGRGLDRTVFLLMKT